VALGVALWLLSACGGSSSTDTTATFKKDFSSVANQFRSTSQAIGASLGQAPSRTAPQLAAEFRALAHRWQSDLTRLGALKPPSSIAGAFNRMTAGATRAETDLNAVAAAAAGNNAAAARHAASSLVTDILAAKSASTTITNKLGIK
jgi:hypothetical protein